MKQQFWKGGYEDIKMKKTLCLSLLLFCFSIFCFLPRLSAQVQGKKATFRITSKSFTDGGVLPARFSCKGAGLSPPLSWQGAPAETKCFALICDDPDAPRGNFVHWVLYDLPANVTALPEGIKSAGQLPSGAKAGKNDSLSGAIFVPACPPAGEHRYFFRIYASGRPTNLKPGARKEELIKAMGGHILAEAQIMARFRK